jgi:hypothetical protein
MNEEPLHNTGKNEFLTTVVSLQREMLLAAIISFIRVVALGGLVVSVLAAGPKVRGFKPGRGRWILRVIKSVALLPSEGK